MAEDPIKKLTPQQFAQKIKQKYPQYKDIGDVELTDKMLKKYPEYSSSVDTEGAFKKYGHASWFSRFWQWIKDFPI